MSDPFGDNFGVETTTQPTDAGANFLAQEQNELAALENQLLDAQITDEANGNDDGMVIVANGDEDLMGGDFTTAQPVVENNNAMEAVDLFGAADTNTSPTTNNVIENSNVDDDVVVLDQTPTLSTPIVANPPAPAYDIKIEPESIRKWREEFNQRIADADAKEQELKEELLAKAKQDLDEWSRQRHETLEKTKKANREAEQIFIEERESRSKEGGDADWSKVSDLCDFNPKTSKGSKDTSRMRSLFLHLKDKK